MTCKQSSWIAALVVLLVIGSVGLAIGPVPITAYSTEGTETEKVTGGVALVKESSLEVAPLSATATYTHYLPSMLKGYEPHFASVFGVQLGGTLTEADTALSLLEAGRSHWSRWSISWWRIEPTNRDPADFVWPYDPWILNADEASQELVVTIEGNPDWAATYRNGRIDLVPISEFAEFMGALVERYDGDGVADAPGSPVVRYWELYNEPDGDSDLRAEYGHAYWGPFSYWYADMLCAIYPAVKAANPEAQVVLGGLAYDHFSDSGGYFRREFLGDVLAVGGGNCFDVMNFHYYPPFEGNWIAYGPGISGKAAYLRQHYSISHKPMMVTEAGWSSSNFSSFTSTPEIQARHVVQFFTQSLYSDLDATIWWTWIDPGGGYGPFGLLTDDLIPKPAYSVFKDAALRLGTATPQERLYANNVNLEVYRFASAEQQPLFVFWSRDGGTHTISLPISWAQIVNMYGDVVYTVTDGSDGHIDGKITVAAGPNPLYAEAAP